MMPLLYFDIIAFKHYSFYRSKPVISDYYTVIFVDHPNPNRLDFTEALWLRMTKAIINLQKMIFAANLT